MGHHLSTMKRNTVIGLAICLSMLAALSSAHDVKAAGSKKKTDGWVQPTHIHMQPMMLPAGRTRAPITFYLQAKKPKLTEDICKRMPRVRDAILRTLSRKPITVKNRRLVLKGLDKRIFGPVNRAVGRNYVSKIFISKGAIRLGAGKIKHRPFAVIDGCVNILRSEREREQAERAANK